MLERVEISFVEVVRVLDGNDILFGEGLVGDQIFPNLCANIELLDGIVRINLSRGPNRHNVGVLGEDLKRDGAAVLTWLI